MNIESVKSLFLLFSGEPETAPYEPVIELAVSETERMLLPGKDCGDMRLNFLAAAIANDSVQRIKASRDRTRVTYAGKMVSSQPSAMTEYSQRLVRDYLQLCEDIIKPRAFVFMSFCGGEG